MERYVSCIVKALGCSGVSFLSVSSTAESLSKHLFGTPGFWIVVVPFFAFGWALAFFLIQSGSEK